jgi:hypothetical protein
MMKKIVAFVIVVSTVTFSINAQSPANILYTTNSSEYVKAPELYFDLDSYFLEETLQWFSFLNRGIRVRQLIGMYNSGYFKYRFPTEKNEDDDHTRMDFNYYLNFNVKIGQYFTIPIFGTLVYANVDNDKIGEDKNDIIGEDSNKKNKYLFGSGLIFESKYGMIGAFSGIKRERESANGQWVISYPFYFVSRLNTGDYPFIGFFLEKILGYSGIKTTGGISAYSGTLASHTVNIKDQDIKFEIYHNAKSYNFEAENRNYGVRVHLLPYWSFDAGFRHYFNVQGDSYNYNNTGYGEIILQIPQTPMLHTFYLSMDNNYFPFPKIGYEISYALGSLSFNFGFTEKYNEYSITLRAYF